MFYFFASVGFMLASAYAIPTTRTSNATNTSASFYLSSEITETTDHAALCIKEFGPNSVVADWVRDLKVLSGTEIKELVYSLGITPTFNKKNYFVTRNGQKAFDTSRVYFFERHDGPAPSN